MTPKDWMKIESLLAGVADKDTLDIVKELVEGIETNLKGSLTANVVRHIQRGTMSGEGDKIITLSGFTNVDKMVVLLFGNSSYATGSSYGEVFDYYLKSLTVDTLVVSGDTFGSSNSIGSYQVIEFY